ncbi:MAG: ABC transporter permease [Anaerohalosphaera sp.]|nr:ABC transporter permease [Anaerohalosphaera sp.]
MKKQQHRLSRKIPWFELTFTALGSCVIIFVIAPLINLAIATSFGDLAEAAADQKVIESIKLTLTAALFATLISVFAGIPLAYMLARKKFFAKSILLAVIYLPIIIPHSAAGIALLTVIGRQSFLGRILGSGLTGTAAGISIAMAFVSIPFLINAAYQAFLAVPVRLENIARTLGASPSHTFFTIALPLSKRGIISGMILMWARGISEFGAVIIVAYHPMTTPVMVFQRLNDYGLVYARSVTVLLIAICVGLFVILRLISNLKKRETE